MRFMVLMHARSERGLSMNLTLVGTSRCDVPAREAAGGIIAPLSAARTAQRAVPTRFRVQSAKISWNSFHEPSLRPRPRLADSFFEDEDDDEDDPVYGPNSRWQNRGGFP